MQSSRIEELKADIQELESLHDLAKRESVKKSIKALIEKLKTSISQAQHDEPKKISTPSISSSSSSGPSFEMISAFSFEQSPTEVKVYIMSLDGIGDLPQSAISCDFQKNGFDLRIMGFKGKNLRLQKRPLTKEIDSSKSKFKVRSSRITLYLAKKESGHWDGLTPSAKLIPDRKDENIKEDPQAALMNMMKDMYQNGDDSMKKMIAESWTKAQEKKGMPEV